MWGAAGPVSRRRRFAADAPRPRSRVVPASSEVLPNPLADAAERAGLDSVHFSEDSENAGDHLANIIRAGDVVLIKGSRGVRTEKVLEKLLEKFQLENSASGKAVK